MIALVTGCRIPRFNAIGPAALEKEKKTKMFTIYRQGGHLGQVTYMIWTIKICVRWWTRCKHAVVHLCILKIASLGSKAKSIAMWTRGVLCELVMHYVNQWCNKNIYMFVTRRSVFRYINWQLILKAPITIAAEDIFFSEKTSRYFVWIVCLADDSHELLRLIFSEKIELHLLQIFAWCFKG